MRTLSRKVAVLVVVNLAAIALLLLVFLQAQFGLGPETILAGPMRERVLATGVQAARDFEGASEAERRGILERYERELQVQIYLISPDGDALDGRTDRVPPAVMARVHEGRPLFPEDGERRPPPPPPPPGSGSGRNKKKGPGRPAEAIFSVTAGSPAEYWIGTRIPVRSWDGEPQPGVLLFRTDSLFRGPLFLDMRMWIGFAVAVLIVSLLCWLPFVQGITVALARMRQSAERIAQGQFQVHAAEPRADEIGDLGLQIDAMAGRLEGFVKGQKRFLGDIAHELSAPIARVQFALGILEHRVRDEGPDVQEAVEELHGEVQEMSQLVSELLAFSKAGLVAGGRVELTVVELLPLVERAATREASGKAELRISIPAGMEALVHPASLSRAVANVVRNAIRHAGGTPIEMTAALAGDRVRMTIADQGPGLPEEALQNVFMPFYRPDDSRERNTGGGAGLGLAIVKDCIETCRGGVACRNRVPGPGLEVEFLLLGTGVRS